MQPFDETVYERCLARPDFTDERDKAFTVLNAIHQPAQRFFNFFGKEEVARIWINVERIVFQSEEAFVHGVCTFPASRYSASTPAGILSLLCGSGEYGFNDLSGIIISYYLNTSGLVCHWKVTKIWCSV
jgi:hypothetical protein